MIHRGALIYHINMYIVNDNLRRDVFMSLFFLGYSFISDTVSFPFIRICVTKLLTVLYRSVLHEAFTVRPCSVTFFCSFVIFYRFVYEFPMKLFQKKVRPFLEILLCTLLYCIVVEDLRCGLIINFQNCLIFYAFKRLPIQKSILCSL